MTCYDSESTETFEVPHPYTVLFNPADIASELLKVEERSLILCVPDVSRAERLYKVGQVNRFLKHDWELFMTEISHLKGGQRPPP